MWVAASSRPCLLPLRPGPHGSPLPSWLPSESLCRALCQGLDVNYLAESSSQAYWAGAVTSAV